MKKQTPDQFVQTVRDQSDIVSIVGSYLALRKAGQNHVGLCPFHSEKTPSFSVSASKQVFHCFGCGVGGDVFQFLMQLEGVSFPEALKTLADRAGIPLPVRPLPARSTEAEEEREALIAINRAAAAYFHKNLKERPEAEAARKYLQNRGIREETLEAFQLGFALPVWDGLVRSLGERFSSRLLEKAGLIATRAEGGERPGYYDRFRARLIFPIANLQGEIIAFGGRALNDQDHPKYLNSPETPLFSKGSHLYGLDRAKKSRERQLILVEGYFDAVVPHQEGVQNVVATLGTALSPEHLRLLRRLCDKTTVLFDPDPAGIRAAIRAAALFAEAGLSAEAVLLPEGEDPDLFIRKRGREAFLSAVAKGTPLMEFALSHLVGGVQSGSIDAKIKAIAEVFPLIQRIQNNLEKSHYLGWLAGSLSIPEEVLRKEFAQVKKAPDSPAKTDKVSPSAPPPKEEVMLVHLTLQRPERIREMQGLDPGDFRDARTRRIVRHLLQPEAVPPPGLEEEGHVLYTELLVREAPFEDPDRAFRDCLEVLRTRKVKEQAREVGQEIRRAEGAGDTEQVKQLQQKMFALKQSISK